MPYLLLIMESPGDRTARAPAEGEQRMATMAAWNARLAARGVLAGSNSLKSEVVRVQTRDGRHSVLDGPFAEAKELVGGYFLLTVDSRAEALKIAAECPAAAWATVEVRETGPCTE